MQILSKDHVVEVYTDGACSGNPGNGGYGIVCVVGGQVVATYSKGFFFTTNNRMEIMAVLTAMRLYEGKAINVWSDSKYVVNGIKYWLGGWAKRGWKKKDGGEIKNLDLWQAIYDQLHLTKIKIAHVKGHNGNRFNEMADRLAHQALHSPEDIDAGFLEVFDIENSERSEHEEDAI